MSIEVVAGEPDQVQYQQHARSVERHASWARDYAAAGDFESAMDALRDLHALVTELTASETRF